MKRIYILLFVVCLFSCKNKEEKLEEKFIPILKDTLEKEKFWVTKVDSIKIYKISEITRMLYALDAINNLKDSKVFYGQFKESQEDLLKDQKKRHEKAKFISYTLIDIQKYADTIQQIQDKIDSIKKRIKLGKISATDFGGYLVRFKYKGSFDTTKIVDSNEYFISPKFKAIAIYEIERYPPYRKK